jgi:GntR family transcriptional repressor for pyruvate dehydrogenase complex
VPGGSPAITAAVFRAVRTGNAFEETVERLLEGVKLGVYSPGDRLPPERELTRRLGISRITLREALRELAAAGYVETKRGRFGGTFIIRSPEPLVHAELTRTARDMGGHLDDALTFRRVVECGAAETRVRLVDLLNAIPMLETNLEHANFQHASIVRAILAGDPERARHAMEEHVAGTAALLRGFLGET